MSDPVTPNMNLTVPTPSVTPGPLYSEDVSDALTIIDAHDHSPGNGVPVGVNGLDLTSDLSLNANRITDLTALRLDDVGSPQTGSIAQKQELQVVGGNLFYIDNLQRPIQITGDGEIATVNTGSLRAEVISSYPYFVLQSDANKILLIDTTVSRMINLPLSNGFDGVISIKDNVGQADSNPITIVPTGSDTIEGLSLAVQQNIPYSVVRLVSNHSSGWIYW